MTSFKSFCEEKDLIKCAELMSNFDAEPAELIENILESDLVEDWKGWAGRAVAAAGQIAGGVQQGIKQAADTMGGPAVKFDKAVAILKDLEKYLRTNPATKDTKSMAKPSRTVAGYIQLIYQALEKESSSMPKVVPASSPRAAQAGGYGMRGRWGPNAAPDQPQTAQAPAQRQKLPAQPANQQPQAPGMKIAQ